ncbi:MAG: ABC transporter substrate-binding protein [Clostridia bacterium]|nr:ABC transporter substrate-binding protein [Clostridia bacterium]
MKKLLVLLALILLLVCTCALADGITVTDMMGREMTFDAPADRVVVMMPADCEIVYALGAKDSLIGIGTYCETKPEMAIMPELAGLPVVNSGYVTNVEQILALAPNAVIMATMDVQPAITEQLESSGVKVVATDAQSLEDVYTDIRLIGKILGKNAEAEELVASMQQQLADIAAKAPKAGKTLYVEESPLEWGLWAAGSGTYMNDLCELLGMTNIFAADFALHQPVSEEAVLERNPDIIVTMMMYYDYGPLPDEEIMNRPGWENVSAVQNDAVLYDETNAVALPGPRLVEVAQMLLDLINGTAVDEVPAA